MKYTFLTLVFLILCSCTLESEDLIIFIDNGIYGYFDSDKNIVIPPKYELATEFKNGLATVKLSENNFAVITETGEIVFKFFSQQVYPESIADGLLLVKNDEFYGYLNLGGEKVLHGFDFARPFSEGYAVVRNGKKYSYINKKGEYVLNNNNNRLEFDSAMSFKEGFARFGVNKNDKLYYGFIDTAGTIIIQSDFEYLDIYFSNGLCGAATKWNGREEFGNFGFIDNTGKWKIPPIYYEVKQFSGNVAPVRYKKAGVMDMFTSFWKLIDLDGKDIIVFDTNIMSPNKFDDGLASFTSRDDDGKYKYGFINEAGEVILEPIIDQSHTFFNNGYRSVSYRGMDAILLENGDIILNDDFFKQ